MPCYKKQRCDSLQVVNNNNDGMKMTLMKDTMFLGTNEDEKESSITSTVPVVTNLGCTIHVDIDDDISLSSSSESSSSSSSIKTKTTRKRVVHFDERQNKIYTINDKVHEYNEDLWYNALDYEQFKLTTLHIANKIAQAGADIPHNNTDAFARTYYKVLQRTYEACCSQAVACCGDNSDITTDKNNSINNIFACATEQKHAQQWIHAASSNGALLGVAEKYSIYEVVLDKSHRRMELISSILEIQEFCKLHHHTIDNINAVAEMIRLTSCEHSLPSCLFAHFMAISVL